MLFINERFNDSLKIYLFHYWMNQHFRINLCNEWFKDVYIFNSAFSPTKSFFKLFYNKYPIPDLKYLIPELESIFNSQTLLGNIEISVVVFF